MSQEKIEKLTPEQEALIPVYREKWRKIALSTEPIDREKAAEALKKVYGLYSIPVPEIVFCSSPYQALLLIFEQLVLPGVMDRCFAKNVNFTWYEQLCERLGKEFVLKIEEQLEQQFLRQFERQLWTQLEEQIREYMQELLNQDISFYEISVEIIGFNDIYVEDWLKQFSLLDFCTSILNFTLAQRKREIEKLDYIIEFGNWTYPFDKLAIICDRPRILSFDNQQRLHAEGAPAIQFADGYSLYAYHDVTLPEKYGKIHPNQWQTSWLLEEENAELRRVLIQGIGYERIASELGAIELDSFEEYSLLKIDTNIDGEPIYMLKMTCPSTGYIHVLRVPPDVRSAREAIRWVNWGVDPEEFAVQT